MAEGKLKARLMDGAAMQRCLTRMAHELIEQLSPLDNVVLVGIRRRGVPLARRINGIIARSEGIALPVGEVDISLYRDDLTAISPEPWVGGADLPFDITGKTVVLVDDVIYTGRTVRAAMEALLDRGRPGRIQLAVLIDRGHRELPIRADHVGKNLPTSRQERVGVRVTEIDGEDGVALYQCEP
ncbi:MAG: bifunctional pyr operon transcriptional regulator/uracil phosphoribosyltransferase PyrR [Clostridia bacterium]|nr:bifunctional pyr operon transcriptional regulator/uracil phosphoribosyltransferase PyrR [Clostridia bacterium]